MAAQSLDDYDLGQQIGKGGFATVYRARQRSNGIDVAIKVTRKDTIADAAMMDRVKNEIIIHRKMKHRNIVSFLGCFEDYMNVYIVLELCGGNLFHYLKEYGPLTESQAVTVIQQLICALEYIHCQGIVHRDLKLSNILLTGDDTDAGEHICIKVCDFGLAVQKEHPDEEHYTLCGTPNYIAPEVASQRAHGYPADLWSVGCLFYTLVVGAPPFEQGDVKDTLERIISGVYTESDKISADGKHFLRSLLHLNPTQRANVKELLVHPLLSPSPSPSPSPIKDALSHSRSFQNTFASGTMQREQQQQQEMPSSEATPTNSSDHPFGTSSSRFTMKNREVGPPLSKMNSSEKKPNNVKYPSPHPTQHQQQWTIERRSASLSIRHSTSSSNNSSMSPIGAPRTALLESSDDSSAVNEDAMWRHLHGDLNNSQAEGQDLEAQIRDLQMQYQHQYLHNHYPADGPNGSVTTASTAIVSYPSSGNSVPHQAIMGKYSHNRMTIASSARPQQHPQQYSLPQSQPQSQLSLQAPQRVLSSGEAAQLRNSNAHSDAGAAPVKQLPPQQKLPQQQPARTGGAKAHSPSHILAPVPVPAPIPEANTSPQKHTTVSQHEDLGGIMRGPTSSSTEPTISARRMRSPQRGPPSTAVVVSHNAVELSDGHGGHEHHRGAEPNAMLRNSLQYQRTLPPPSRPIGGALTSAPNAHHHSSPLHYAARVIGNCSAGRNNSVSVNFLHGLPPQEIESAAFITPVGANISAISTGVAHVNSNSSLRSSRSSRSWLENLSDLRSSLNGSAGSVGLRQSTTAAQYSPGGPSNPQTGASSQQRNYHPHHGLRNEEMRSWQQQYTYEKFIGTPPEAHQPGTRVHSADRADDSATSPQHHIGSGSSGTASPVDIHGHLRQDMQWLRPFCLTTPRGELLLLTLERDLVLASKVAVAPGKGSPSTGAQPGKQNYIRLVLSSAMPGVALIGAVNEVMQEEATQIMLDVIKSRESAKLSEVADLNMSSNLDDFVCTAGTTSNGDTVGGEDSTVSGFKFHLQYSSAQLRLVSDHHHVRQFPLSNSNSNSNSPARGSEHFEAEQLAEGRLNGAHGEGGGEGATAAAEIPSVVLSLLRRALSLLRGVRSRVPKLIVYFAAPVESPAKAKSASTTGDLNCKCMLMSNEPYPDFYMRWTDGAKLRYELHTGRLHIEKPAAVVRPQSSRSSGGGGAEGGIGQKKAASLRWSGVLNMCTVGANSAAAGDILPELVPYALIAQKALTKCLQDVQRSSCNNLASSTASYRAAAHVNSSNPIPKILSLD